MDNTTSIKKIKKELADIILDFNIVSSDEYAKLTRHSKQTKEELYDLILQTNNIDMDQLYSKLEEKYGIQYMSEAAPIATRKSDIPDGFCKKNGIVAMDINEKNLTVGLSVPSSLNALKNLALLTNKKVKSVFIPPDIVFEELGLKKAKPIKSDNAQSKNGLDKKIASEVQSANDSQSNLDPSNELDAEPVQENLTAASEVQTKQTQKLRKLSLSSDVVKSVEEILTHAIETGVSDVHFEIFKDKTSIRIRKNGSLIEVDEYKRFIADNYNAVIARIKILSNLDIAERRLPQDGKIAFKTKSNIEVDFRVSVLPTSLGERLVIRILNSSSLALNIEDLGFSNDQLKLFIKAIDAPQGMVLVTGPTGSGKSTTLYGAINYLNKADVNILTAEDPVEYTLSGISQVQVREDIGLTFASALRSFLRQDPEIILVGEIRDTETADIATKAALTGHLVLSTLHTNSAIGVISRLVNMGLPPYLIASGLSMVVAQRLVRVNCKSCLKEVSADVKLMGSLEKEFPELKNAKTYQSVGCEQCQHTGYSGRKAVHEVLPITNRIQNVINMNESDGKIYKIALEEGFITMQKRAIEFILDGSLSLEEFFRSIPSTKLLD